MLSMDVHELSRVHNSSVVHNNLYAEPYLKVAALRRLGTPDPSEEEEGAAGGLSPAGQAEREDSTCWLLPCGPAWNGLPVLKVAFMPLGLF